MKKVMTSLAFIVGLTAYAQVGINATESEIASDAVFQVKNKTGEKKGVILPEVTLANVNEVLNGSDNSDGLLVWNNGGSLAKGYYYWDGTSWAKVGAGRKEIGAIYEKVRIYREDTFTASDIQDDDYILVFTDVEQINMPNAENYKTRTLCFRNATPEPFGTGAKQIVVFNTVGGNQTINQTITRCYTSFQDTDNQWYWIATSL